MGRGFISLEMANEINDRLVAEINKNGGRIDGVFICPNAPEETCNCRKPRPGLLHEARKTLSIDLSRSVIIGDALSDLLAGQSAGLDIIILVRTGRGAMQVNLSEVSKLRPFLIFDTLFDAILAIK